MNDSYFLKCGSVQLQLREEGTSHALLFECVDSLSFEAYQYLVELVVCPGVNIIISLFWQGRVAVVVELRLMISQMEASSSARHIAYLYYLQQSAFLGERQVAAMDSPILRDGIGQPWPQGIRHVEYSFIFYHDGFTKLFPN